MKARNDQVILQFKDPAPKKTDGLSAPPKQESILTVITVGPLIEDLKEGDRVLATAFPEERFTVEGVDYIVIPEKQVRAIV